MVSTREITEAALQHYDAIKVLEKIVDEKLREKINRFPFLGGWQIIITEPVSTITLDGLFIRYRGYGWLVERTTSFDHSTKSNTTIISFKLDNPELVASRIRRAFYIRGAAEEPDIKEGSRSIKVTLS